MRIALPLLLVAGATAVHDAIVKANDGWIAAVDALAAELDRVQDAQAAAELKEFEAEKSYSYWFRFMTIRANDFLRLARRDPVKAEAVIPQFETAYAGYTEFTKGKGATINETFAGYGKQVDRFGAAVAKVKPALAAAKTPEDKGKALDEAFESLVDAYNTMVSLHNTLIGAEGRGDLK